MGKASKQAIVELIFLHMKLYPKLIEKKKKKKTKLMNINLYIH